MASTAPGMSRVNPGIPAGLAALPQRDRAELRVLPEGLEIWRV
jgi:hypothetical protein